MKNSCFTGILSTILLLAIGCAHANYNTPPYIPFHLMNAIEVEASFLISSYLYTCYAVPDRRLANNAFVNRAIVFRNIQITRDMENTVQDGYLWISLIKCNFGDSSNLQEIKVGQSADIVGICQGLVSEGFDFVLLKDCRLLPVGSVSFSVNNGTDIIPQIY